MTRAAPWATCPAFPPATLRCHRQRCRPCRSCSGNYNFGSQINGEQNRGKNLDGIYLVGENLQVCVPQHASPAHCWTAAVSLH